MIHVQVTYRIRKERAVEAEREIAGFVATLQSNRPRFATYHIFRRADDAASLVHFITFRDHEAQLAHTQSPHIKRFVENMLPLCEVGPVYTDLKDVFTKVATAN
jgi:quinol monooxygenase YgiN